LGIYLILCTLLLIGELLKVRGVLGMLWMMLYWFLLIPPSWLDAIFGPSKTIGPLSQAHPMLSVYIFNMLFSVFLALVFSLGWYLILVTKRELKAKADSETGAD
jgi:hypothetical protein